GRHRVDRAAGPEEVDQAGDRRRAVEVTHEQDEPVRVDPPASARASATRHREEYGLKCVPMTVSGPRSVATVTSAAAWWNGPRTRRVASTFEPGGTRTATGWPDDDRAR